MLVSIRSQQGSSNLTGYGTLEMRGGLLKQMDSEYLTSILEDILTQVNRSAKLVERLETLADRLETYTLRSTKHPGRPPETNRLNEAIGIISELADTYGSQAVPVREIYAEAASREVSRNMIWKARDILGGVRSYKRGREWFWDVGDTPQVETVGGREYETGLDNPVTSASSDGQTEPLAQEQSRERKPPADPEP